ncbi:MAG: AhpC/TSA family protein [Bacteroidales bacterium]|nr:AhpC/TSA family protein [Bacteroidales bacterium]
MKNFLIIALIAMLAACQPAAEKSFTLHGEVEGLEEGYVYLFDRVHGLYQLVDSAEVVDGRFTLTGSLDFPEFLYLDHFKGVTPRIAFFLENSEMTLQFAAENAREFTLTGSASHDLLQDFNLMVAGQDANLRVIQQQALEAEVLEDSELAEALKAQYKTAEAEKRNQIRTFVDNHNNTPVGIYIAMRNLATELDGEGLDALVKSFDPALKDSRYYVSLRERADKILALAEGKTAPEFNQPDVDGNMVALSDFRGQYLLVSFWASWCPFCRQENPHLVKLYEQYADRNFEILGVSLDRNHEAWLKAIADDGLNWAHVSDLNGWQNEASTLYGVASIPSNILLDPDGIILGRNLKGEVLDQKLEELLSPEV